MCSGLISGIFKGEDIENDRAICTRNGYNYSYQITHVSIMLFFFLLQAMIYYFANLTTKITIFGKERNPIWKVIIIFLVINAIVLTFSIIKTD